jgi:hypothetical protein
LIPKTEYFTIDLFETTDQELENSIELGELRAAYLALKHGHDPDYLKTNAPFLFNFAMGLKPKNLLHLFLKWVSEYIQRRTKLSESEFVHLLTADSQMSTQFKTFIDNIRERARAEFADEINESKKNEKKAKADALQAKAEIRQVKSEAMQVKADALQVKADALQIKAEAEHTKVEALIAKAKAKDAEAKAEAKAKDAEAKAEAQLKAFIKSLMRTTLVTDEQLVTQFAFSTELVAAVRAELNAL